MTFLRESTKEIKAHVEKNVVDFIREIYSRYVDEALGGE